MIERYPVTDRAAWLAMRSQDLTASDIGAALGLDPYKSRLAVYAEKTGLLMPQADNNAMRRGRWLEAAVLSAIREQNPDWEVRPAAIYLRDPEIRLGGTPDALAATDKPGITNVQCKVVNRPAFERDWAEGPPMRYMLQTLAEGMLLRADQSLIAALVIDTYTAELELFEVPRHDGAEARLRQVAVDFWAMVAAGQPELMRERSTTRTIIEVETQRLAEIDAEIKAKLGEHERAELPGWKISWKTQTRKEHMVAASTFRALRVTETETT
jgi:predicted phage-related endonuclease